MKLTFVGAALLISVLSTDAQWYSGSQSSSVSTNHNPQVPDPNLIPNLPPPPPRQGYSGSQGYSVSANYNPQPPNPGYTGYRVDTYYGNSPPPSPSSLLDHLWSKVASTAKNTMSTAQDILGSIKDWFGGSSGPSNGFPPPPPPPPPASSQDMWGSIKDWLGVQSNPSNRPYPVHGQAYYNPFASSQAVAYPYNQPRSGNNQVGVPSGPYNGFLPPPPPPPPVSSQVGVPSGPYNGFPAPAPPPPPPVSSQVVVPSGPYNGLPPPPPPPPVNSQVGAPSDNYDVPPPPPPPPLASIQVTSSSDSNNGPPPPPPANSQPYNVKLPVPSQNAM